MNKLQASLDRCASTRAPKVSFEFFPPKTEAMETGLWDAIQRLAPYRPDFVSVTYGAGGTTRERTHNTVCRILAETEVVPAAHLTCVGASRSEVLEVAQRYWNCGVRHLVALRGDPPAGAGGFVAHPDGFDCAADLVQGLREIGDFEISVACYPEPHPDSRSEAADIEYLKRKVDAGATRAITQFFFDGDTFLRFRDQAVAAGIDVPLVPGILPVTNFERTRQFAAQCGASIPEWFAELFADLDADPGTRQLVAATAAAEQCQGLYLEGVDEFHFYTLNRAELTGAICRMLGVRPANAHDSRAA